MSAIIFFFSLVVGCQRDGHFFSRTTMDTQTSRIDELFEKTRLICFGRFVLTVPATAIAVYGPAEAESELFFHKDGAEKIGDFVTMRLAEIEKERLFMQGEDYKNLPLFGQVRDGVRDGQKIVVGSKERVGYSVHSYLPIGQDLYVQYFPGIMPDENPFAAINDVARNLTARDNDFIPDGPGMCIDSGFIARDMMFEQVTIGIRLKEFPDVHLSIETLKNQQFLPSQNELEVSLRGGEEDARQRGGGAVFDRITTFRHGPRQLGIWQGFEHAARMPAYEKNSNAHEFYFHANGAINDRLQPRLDIQLDSGVVDDNKASIEPSITDEEALALWDKLITSIRLRRSGDATPVRTKLPLASTCTTGEQCPESGWWETLEARPIVGARRRRFTVGEKFPAVEHEVAPNLWQKMTGKRLAYQRSTTWRLIEHAEHRAPE